MALSAAEQKKWNDFIDAAFALWTVYSTYGQRAKELAAEPDLLKLERKARTANPQSKIDIGTIARLRMRGDLTKDQAVAQAKAQGYDEVELNRLINSTEPRLDLSALIELRRRGLLNDAGFRSGMGELGYSSTTQSWYLDLVPRLAGIQDEVRFLVRDVYDSTVRKSLRLDEDYPAAFTATASRLGFDEDTAKRFWAAHWSLPSMQQAFEMLHRRFITEDDIDQLLKAHDVLPKFRQPFKDIAYRPLTRVDVRRMHDLGVLTDVQVKNAYKDLGYNDTNAGHLLEFTRQYNADAPAVDEEAEARRLTRSEIIQLYRRRDIDGAAMREYLVQLGYSEELADLIATSEELERKRNEQDKLKAALRKLVMAGIVKPEDAASELAGSGLAGEALEAAVSETVAVDPEDVKTPSLGQWNRMLHQGIVPPAAYLRSVVAMGYPVETAGDLLESYGPGATSDAPRPGGRLQLVESVREGRIDYNGWLQGMADIGYSAEYALQFAHALTEEVELDDEPEEEEA